MGESRGKSDSASAAQAYYDWYWSADGYSPPGRLQADIQELLGRHVPAGTRCVDVGCGDGRGAGAWLTARRCEYVGLDVSQNAVDLAGQLGLDARLIGDAAELPLESDQFDVAICIEVLEHVFQPKLAAAELLRVLKPGGVVIVTVPNVAYWMRRLAFALAGKWDPMGDDLSSVEPWRDPHIRFFTAGALRKMLELVGFVDVGVGGHAGGFLRDLPWLGSRVEGETSGTYKRAQQRLPALLALRLHAVAVKPEADATVRAA